LKLFSWINGSENNLEARKKNNIHFEDIPLNTFKCTYEEVNVPYDVPYRFRKHTYENVKPLSLGSELATAQSKLSKNNRCKYNPLKMSCQICKSDSNLDPKVYGSCSHVYQSFDFGLDAKDMSEHEYESPITGSRVEVAAEVHNSKK